MSLEKHKITTYKDNVTDLPDNPSAAGYTAQRLKEIFDGRGDKEIKEKHNGLIDELIAVLEEMQENIAGAGADAEKYADGAVEEHDASEDAHSDIRTLISELTRRLNAALDSDDITLDQLSELVAYIKDNRSLIDAVTTAKVGKEELNSLLEGYATESQVDAIYKYWTRHDAETNPHGITPKMIGTLTEEQIKNLIRSVGGSGGGDVDFELLGKGTEMISVHDEAYKTLVPADGAVYVVKFHDMPYGEDPSLISPEVFYRIKIGDGTRTLAELPVISNIQAGNGAGSIRNVDPTYDGGDDGLEAANNIADGQYGVAFGKYLKNRGKAAAAFNYSNEITENGQRSFVVNMKNLADAGRVFISGYNNTVKGIGGGIYGGSSNTIEANAKNPSGNHQGTIVGGSGNKLLGYALYSILVGNHLISDTERQIVLGAYNTEDPDAVLIVGCGTDETDRRNALVVKKDGTVFIKGEDAIKIGDTTVTESQLKKLLALVE